MQKIKMLRPWIPEIYLMVSVIYYWSLTGTLLNPVAIILLLILSGLVTFKNCVLGLSISVLLLLLNFYMVMALISEFNEFPSFNQRAQELIFFGSAYLGLNIALSFIMLIKWSRKWGQQLESVQVPVPE
jgi:hypothetical protein